MTKRASTASAWASDAIRDAALTRTAALREQPSRAFTRTRAELMTLRNRAMVLLNVGRQARPTEPNVIP
jgi:hypothetical protein